MENVILVTFKNNEEARLAFDGVDPRNADIPCTIHDMAIVAKVDGKIGIMNESNKGVDNTNDTLYGAILGTIIGILGGPLGMLIGAGIGTGAGAILDATDIDEEDAMLVKVSAILANGQEAIAAYVTEDEDGDFVCLFDDYDTVSYCFPAEEFAAEVESAQHLQHKIARAVREELKDSQQ